MGSIAVDLGNGWRTRRALISATDASALAAAQDIVEDGGAPCEPAAGTYMNLNDNAASWSCQKFGSADQGYVSVEATTNVETWFAPVIGQGDFDAPSFSAAMWAPPAAVTGLRPIGLCIDGSAALQGVVNNPPATNTVIRVDYDKDQPDACGGASVPGNWGTVDFDGGSNSNNDTKDWITNGYPGEVHFSNHAVSSCGAEAHCYPGDTGALAGINSELNGLQASGQFFTLPVFNFVEGNGSNASFHLMGVVRVKLLSYKVNGNPNGRYFELLVEPGLITGTCCGSPGGASGNKVVILCAVDPDDLAACNP